MAESEARFKAGDRVVCVDDGGGKYLRNGQEYVIAGASGGVVAVHGVTGSHWASRFRLSQPSAPLGEVYGTCPPDAELPPELPAGTRHASGLWIAKSTVRLDSDGFYSGHWERDDGSASETDGGFTPRGIDWSKIPRAQPDAKEGGPEDDGPRVGETWLIRRPRDNKETEAALVSSGAKVAGFPLWRVRDAALDGVPVGGALWLGGKMHDYYLSLIHRIAPAPTDATGGKAQKPDSFTPTCADCGKPIENPLEACARAARDSVGRVVELPGAVHAKCPTDDACPECKMRDGQHTQRCTRDWPVSQSPADVEAMRIREERAMNDAKLSIRRGYRDDIYKTCEDHNAYNAGHNPARKVREKVAAGQDVFNLDLRIAAARQSARPEATPRTPANRKAAERLKAEVAETLKSWPERDGWEP